MSISELLYLFVEPEEQHFKIYSLEKETYIFDGFLESASDELLENEVLSIDNIIDESIIFNID